METRKIQQVGGGTYTVSLPKQWATAADIEPGVAVALHTHIDGTLVVQTEPGTDAPADPLALAIDDVDPARIESVLRAAYAAGVETVELDAGAELTGTQRRTIERTTREMTGVTITESTERTVRIRSLLDAEEVSISQSVRQLQFTALSAHRTATAALSDPTPDTADGQVTRQYRMVARYFQQGLDSLAVMDALGLTRPELFSRWVTARELDAIADHAGRVVTVASRVETPVDEAFADEFDELAGRARAAIEDAVSIVVDDGGIDAACGVCERCDALRTDLEALDRDLFDAGDAEYRLTHAVDALRRTVESAETVAQAGLQARLRDHQTADSPLDIGNWRDEDDE